MRVTLRKENLSKGRKSLYLDIYIDKNKNKQKRLKMYLIPEKSEADKQKNKDTILIAEKIRNKYEMELLNNKYGLTDPKEKYNYSFIEYFDIHVKERYESGTNYDTWVSTQKHLHKFTNKKLSFNEISESWMERFKSYLLTKVSQNSAHSYFNILKRNVHTAFRDRLLETDPCYNVKSPKQTNPKREFLTEEELLRLKDVECRYPVMKRAFMFSVLTGLRWSDVHNLRWGNVIDSNDSTSLSFKMQKTNDAERLPINKEARKLLGERRNIDDKAFQGLRYGSYQNVALKEWMLKAGIFKHITFHCARHTHATLLLNKGVDIYTVSKLLGHKEIKTTQIYAKIVNKTKEEAIEKLPTIFA